jgi:hypothetical protein
MTLACIFIQLFMAHGVLNSVVHRLVLDAGAHRNVKWRRLGPIIGASVPFFEYAGVKFDQRSVDACKFVDVYALVTQIFCYAPAMAAIGQSEHPNSGFKFSPAVIKFAVNDYAVVCALGSVEIILFIPDHVFNLTAMSRIRYHNEIIRLGLMSYICQIVKNIGGAGVPGEQEPGRMVLAFGDALYIASVIFRGLEFSFPAVVGVGIHRVEADMQRVSFAMYSSSKVCVRWPPLSQLQV